MENPELTPPSGYSSRTVLTAAVLGAALAATAVLGFVSLGRGGSSEPTPTPTVSASASSEAVPTVPKMRIETPTDDGLSTSLVVCASDPVEALVQEASPVGGVFSPATAPLEALSAVWRWEMPGSGELVVVAVDTDGIDPSARALLESPGAVDALGDAGGVLDHSSTAVSGRWWVGIGTAFSVAVPLRMDQVTDAASHVAACLNGSASPTVRG